MKTLSVPTKPNLKSLFEPKHIALIGASRRTESVGYAILSNLISNGFKGDIYPVNPKADELSGLHCYHTVTEIPYPVDLAIVVVPSVNVPDTLRRCGEKGIRAAIIISAGFKEIGPDGLKLEQELSEVAKRYGIAVLGPNCLGLSNTDSNVCLNASFSRTMPRAGNIAFVSQSGALCAAILDYAKGENIGFSKFVSLGNKANINELQVLEYLKDDPKTDVILMYLEDLVDGKSFIQLAREITGDQKHLKPILAIKAGRTPQGAKAASSHTGSLMGSDEVYDAIFAQAGVLRVDSVEEIFHLAAAFSSQPIPQGKRVAIVTNAGGPGIMATDACVRYGLEMAELSSETRKALKLALPPTANLSNPIDVIGDAQHDRYDIALRHALSDPNVDSVIVILTPQAMTDIDEIARVVVRWAKESPKVLLSCFMGFVDVSSGIKILEDNHVPHYKFPEAAARTLAGTVRYKQWIDRPRTKIKSYPADLPAVKKIIANARAQKRRVLDIYEGMQILQAYGFPLLPFAVAKNAEEAMMRAKKIGFPLALKVVSSDIIHKFDVGGVKINLTTAKELKLAINEMTSVLAKHQPNAKVDGFLIQQMGKKGREVILGMNRDPHFGPILMFGLGGIYVEVLKDVTFRLAPVRELGAKRMIESIRSYRLLKGVRGEAPADMTAISECLSRLSQLSCDQHEISEIDINPLVVYDDKLGAHVIDARIILN